MESLLSKFSFLPQPGTVTVCETDGRFVYADEDDESQFNGTNMVVPSFLIDAPLTSGDVSTSFTLPYTNESAFYPPPDNPLKNSWLTWRDKGTMELLETLCTESDDSSRTNKTVSCMLKCFKHCHAIYCTMTLQPKQIHHSEILEGFATVPKWSSSVIRAISVHPHLPILAVARNDDIVEIRDVTSSIDEKLPVLLKDRSQIAISCLQWACHSNTLLAVGVLGGVILWYIDIRHPNTRHPCVFLPCFNSCPIVAMTWCPKGRLLACATPTDSTLLIWDVPLMSSTKLKRVHGGGVSLLSWSPKGDWLFSSHVESLCRVWESTQWTCDKWTNLAGRCKASCWSPGGQYLLFTMDDDPSLYYMAFNGPHMTLGGNGVSAAVKCADLSECCLGDDDSDPTSWVGGRVQSLSWDKSGERLAVLFCTNNIGGSKVVVFRTQCSPVLELFPGGFVLGKKGDVPVWVEFADCFSNPTVLVTGWDSGRVSFTPMSYYSSTGQLPEKIGTLYHLAPPTSTLAPPTSTIIIPSTSLGPPTSSLYTKL